MTNEAKANKSNQSITQNINALNKSFVNKYNILVKDINDWNADDCTGICDYREQFISIHTEADIQIIKTDPVLEDIWYELGDLEDLLKYGKTF